MEPLEHSVLATAAVWEPLEHLRCVVTDHVNIDSFWMAPCDAGGTIGDGWRPCVISWWTVLRSVVQLSCRPVFVDVDCSRLFRSLGLLCVLDMHGGHTDVSTGRPGHDPRRNLPPSPMSPGDGGVSLSLRVPVMGKSSRRSTSGITGIGHSPAMCEISAVEVDAEQYGLFPTLISPRASVAQLSWTSAGRAFGRARMARKSTCDYIRPAPCTCTLAGSSVCARTVTGSLLFGSPTCTELSLLSGSPSSVD